VDRPGSAFLDTPRISYAAAMKAKPRGTLIEQTPRRDPTKVARKMTKARQRGQEQSAKERERHGQKLDAIRQREQDAQRDAVMGESIRLPPRGTWVRIGRDSDLDRALKMPGVLVYAKPRPGRLDDMPRVRSRAGMVPFSYGMVDSVRNGMVSVGPGSRVPIDALLYEFDKDDEF